MENSKFGRSFVATPRIIEDTFKTKKRESAKVISETIKEGVKYIVLEPQSIPRFSKLKFNNGYQKTTYSLKDGMDRFRMAQRSHF